LPLRRQDLAVSLAHKAAQAEAEEAAKVKATKSAEQQAVARQHKNAFCFCIPYGQTYQDLDKPWGNLFGK